MYYVYCAQCEDGSIYTGSTNDLAKRLEAHKNKKGGSYTRSHPVKKFIHTEEFPTKGEALKREAEIKRMSRAKKLLLAS